MKAKAAVLAVCISFFVSNFVHAEERYSFGMGFGLMYTGLGFSVARHADSALAYLSVGCLGLGPSSDNLNGRNCGVSAGYMSSLKFSNPRVSVGRQQKT